MSNNIQCKIVILGESGVGKTCIINNFLGLKFVDEFISTFAAEQQNKKITVDDKIVTINFWDTAGQENFRSIAKLFYKGADIIILVYDITSKKSFEEIKNYWYDEVINNTKDLSGKISFLKFNY